MELIQKCFDEYDFILDAKAMDQLIYAGLALENYRSLVTFNFLLVFIRLVTIMSRVFPRTKIFFNSLSNASNDILSFFVMFITLLTSYSIYLHIFYGYQISMFSDFLFCMVINYNFVLGFISEEIYLEMYDVSPSVTLIYFLLLVFIIRYIILRILLAIILYFFKLSDDAYDNQNKDFGFVELTKKELKNKYSDNTSKVLNKYISCVNKLFDCICCKKSIGKYKNVKSRSTSIMRSKQIIVAEEDNPLNKDEFNKSKRTSVISSPSKNNINSINNKDLLNEQQEEKLNPSELESLNISYDPNYALQVKNAYFDSQKDDFKLKVFYETKYKTIFIHSLTYLFLLVIITLMICLNNISPWQRQVYTSIKTQLIKNYTSKKTGLLTINNISKINIYINKFKYLL
jgi:hypothetical protein